MRKIGLFVILVMTIASLAIISCQKKPDTCKDGETVDKRAGGMLASSTYGLCISKEVTETKYIPSVNPTCIGIVVNVTTDSKNGVEEKYCQSGCSADNYWSEKDICVSAREVGDKCKIIADCNGFQSVCFSDPQVNSQLVSQFSQLVLANPTLQSTLTSLGYKKVTAGLIIGDSSAAIGSPEWGLGFNFCTIMNCGSKDSYGNLITCPEGSKCVDIGNVVSKLMPGTELGSMICMADSQLEQPDTVVVPDDAAVNEDDSAAVGDEDNTVVDDGDVSTGPVCMGQTCATHADCPKDSCAATFCAKVLETAMVKAGYPAPAPVCAVRCDPKGTGSECPPDASKCNDVTIATMLDPTVDLDGATGVCAPPAK